MTQAKPNLIRFLHFSTIFSTRPPPVSNHLRTINSSTNNHYHRTFLTFFIPSTEVEILDDWDVDSARAIATNLFDGEAEKRRRF